MMQDAQGTIKCIYCGYNPVKEVFDDDIIKIQFACLESWCASRHEGKGDYCENCRRLNELIKKH